MNYLCEGQHGHKHYSGPYKLHLMPSIDCGNVTDTFIADIWYIFVCV